jgi:hypothetical protein
MENELMIGSVSASAFLMIVLALILRPFPKFPKVYKPYIAIIVGIGFAFLYVIYNEIPIDAKIIIDYTFRGMMVGLTAVGFNEIGGKRIPGLKKKPDPD